MFNISEFIRINRVYFIWAVFMGLLYLFRNMFGLVFITFIMCFVVSGITHRVRRKYHLNRRVLVVCIYLLFLMGVSAFLLYIPPRILVRVLISAIISMWRHLFVRDMNGIRLVKKMIRIRCLEWGWILCIQMMIRTYSMNTVPVSVQH